MTMTAILYSFRRCPYAMRGRMGLAASGAVYEHREVLLRDKPAAMLKASPKGTVPVFITEQGTVVDESLDVMMWALGQNDPRNWLDCDGAAADALIAANDGPFKHHLDRYKYASRYDENAPRGAVDESHRAAAIDALAPLEARLKTTPYLMGKTRTLADIATFPFIRQFAATEPDWWAGLDKPDLKTWLKTNLESDLFKTIMKKHPLWEENT